MGYGISIRDRDVESELTKYNLKYILKPAKEGRWIAVKNLDYHDFNPNSESWKNKIPFVLPAETISVFKNNGWRFHFIPEMTGSFSRDTLEVLPLVDYRTVFTKLKNWDGVSNIEFYATVIPISYISMWRFDERRSGNRYENFYVSMNILVGFQ